jgi:hypothetical protein
MRVVGSTDVTNFCLKVESLAATAGCSVRSDGVGIGAGVGAGVGAEAGDGAEVGGVAPGVRGDAPTGVMLVGAGVGAEDGSPCTVMYSSW